MSDNLQSGRGGFADTWLCLRLLSRQFAGPHFLPWSLVMCLAYFMDIGIRMSSLGWEGMELEKERHWGIAAVNHDRLCSRMGIFVI